MTTRRPLLTGAMTLMLTMPAVLIWPPIHSMVVVTSPMGDQAPPALPMLLPPYIAPSLFRISRYQPPAGTPIR